MAKNLQSKLPSSDTFLVHDVNAEITKKFASEAASGGAQVKVADDVRQAAENSVSIPILATFCFTHKAFHFI